MSGLTTVSAKRILAIACGLALCNPSRADDPKLVQDGQARAIAPWTTKGMTVNPVAICFDPQGNLYIAESDRAGNAVQDTRHITNLNAVEEDLKFKTVEDRRAQIHRWMTDKLDAEPFKGEKNYFTKTEDRVRVLSDTTGKGVADQSKVFAGGFNDELDGIGAGVLWLNGTLYYTCIPNVWALKAAPGSLKNAKRTSLSYGYGVRWCFYGHDLHGLVAGPDGRIYFSMGDRGFNVTTKEGKHLVGPDRGGVFRCWPDGSELELVYQGLRNPQDLAFNELGDLFTGDNNCDSGDKARIVHIVEGGDSGWRQDVQSLESRGPWNRESIWKTLAEVSGPARPAWTLPPVEYMCDGPSGIKFYPGTGESHAYDGCFFLVDFYGSGSTIHAFRAMPQGAGFRVADHVDYYKGVTITDIAWGADGRLFMSDWGGGWDPNPNGGIYTVTNKTVHDNPIEAVAIKEAGQLIKSGMTQRPIDDLFTLLHHRDQRIRQNAQFELASRSDASTSGLAAIATSSTESIVTRAHAIWALGQIARRSPATASRIMPLLSDPEAEIRAQAARTLGDLPPAITAGLVSKCINLLKDPAPRVRLAAAIALGRSGDQTAAAPLLDLLAENNNSDLVIRHGASYALSLVAKPDEIARRAKSMNAAARLGAVIALRRLSSEFAGSFLLDDDAAVAIESARAIYDNRLAGGMPKLAAIISSPIPKDRAIEPLMRRAIAANVLVGEPACALRLAEFASRADVDAQWRQIAIERLEDWDKPLKREDVWGNWADLPPHPAPDVDVAIKQYITPIEDSAKGDENLLKHVYRLQARHILNISPDEMAAQVSEESRPEGYRLAVLNQLSDKSPGAAARLSQTLINSPSSLLRARAVDLLAKSDPAKAIDLLNAAAHNGEVKDRQRAIKAIASLPAASDTVTSLAQDLASGKLDRTLALDIYEAAMKQKADSPARAVVEKLGIQSNWPKGYSAELLSFGGDPAEGRDIFYKHPTTECLRCHTIDDTGGNAGPNLSTVGSRLTTDKLVESLIDPSAVIAKGYGAVTAMPPMPQFLKPNQIRDVVAFLQTLRNPSLLSDHSDAHLAATSPTINLHLDRIFTALLVLVLASLVWRAIVKPT